MGSACSSIHACRPFVADVDQPSRRLVISASPTLNESGWLDSGVVTDDRVG